MQVKQHRDKPDWFSTVLFYRKNQNNNIDHLNCKAFFKRVLRVIYQKDGFLIALI